MLYEGRKKFCNDRADKYTPKEQYYIYTILVLANNFSAR